MQLSATPPPEGEVFKVAVGTTPESRVQLLSDLEVNHKDKEVAVGTTPESRVQLNYFI